MGNCHLHLRIANFRNEVEKCLTGKYDKVQKPKSWSAISVQEPNKMEINQIKNLVINDHPLLHIFEPDTWKNIPICVVDGFK